MELAALGKVRDLTGRHGTQPPPIALLLALPSLVLAHLLLALTATATTAVVGLEAAGEAHLEALLLPPAMRLAVVLGLAGDVGAVLLGPRVVVAGVLSPRLLLDHVAAIVVLVLGVILAVLHLVGAALGLALELAALLVVVPELPAVHVVGAALVIGGNRNRRGSSIGGLVRRREDHRGGKEGNGRAEEEVGGDLHGGGSSWSWLPATH
mmetsp:Transcript_10489/g.29479  ORF Transcript_10489/g.29479 Transcript_10489/m.29479 type:complete len:209 (-) Transcript_10489:44-670(-)